MLAAVQDVYLQNANYLQYKLVHFYLTPRYIHLTDYMQSVVRARSVIAKLILGGVKYYRACDSQRSYLQDASFFVKSDGRAID